MIGRNKPQKNKPDKEFKEWANQYLIDYHQPESEEDSLAYKEKLKNELLEWLDQRSIASKGALMDWIEKEWQPKGDQTSAEQPKLRKRIWNSPIRGGFLYLLMALIVGMVFLMNTGGGPPRNIAGFSGFTVLTSTMEREIPRGSFILTQVTDPQELEIGDDITFMIDQTTVVTHRIIAIEQNYQESGQPAFQTQGIENLIPDNDMVFPENIVGRVIYHNFTIGRIISFIQGNILLIGIMGALLVALSFTLRMMAKKNRE